MTEKCMLASLEIATQAIVIPDPTVLRMVSQQSALGRLSFDIFRSKRPSYNLWCTRSILFPTSPARTKHPHHFVLNSWTGFNVGVSARIWRGQYLRYKINKKTFFCFPLWWSDLSYAYVMIIWVLRDCGLSGVIFHCCFWVFLHFLVARKIKVGKMKKICQHVWPRFDE